MRFVIGVDEAGRGPIAGPVVVGVFMVEMKRRGTLHSFFSRGTVRDSKKLSASSREDIYEKLVVARERGTVSFAVSFGSVKIIETKGIVFAIRDAMSKALKKLKVEVSACEVLLDGALRAPSPYTNQKTIIRGDEKEAVIALASIVAKVSRDRIMRAFSKKYPHYNFEKHKGYGTASHYHALRRYGVSPLHRRSFLKNVAL
ncbi:MAG: ribonuclease HII [Candidatus Taylorbacteria bacterium]|nr:ribonuclease HII [Candidatus Taylorbacteria bacterium]